MFKVEPMITEQSTKAERLAYLQWHFEQKPESLPLRNAIAHLEKEMGLESTVVAVDPIKLINRLENRGFLESLL